MLFSLDGHLEVGEVLMTIGVKGSDEMSLSCVISCWETLARAGLECATVHNVAKNGKHCVVHIPFEYRLT